MPRSHKPRKRYVPKRMDANPVELVISGISLLMPHQVDELTAPTRAAFAAFRAGHGTADAWDDLADALNVAEALARLNIANDHGHTIEAAQAALAAVHARYQQRRSFTLYPAEITALDDALFIHGVQLRHCSQAEALRAISDVKERTAQALGGNASPTTHVCVGRLRAAA